ncbi:MAG TPA: hypothetical protein VF472_16805 [Burkholderiaceae bacterium]
MNRRASLDALDNFSKEDAISFFVQLAFYLTVAMRNERASRTGGRSRAADARGADEIVHRLLGYTMHLSKDFQSWREQPGRFLERMVVVAGENECLFEFENALASCGKGLATSKCSSMLPRREELSM